MTTIVADGRRPGASWQPTASTSPGSRAAEGVEGHLPHGFPSPAERFRVAGVGAEGAAPGAIRNASGGCAFGSDSGHPDRFDCEENRRTRRHSSDGERLLTRSVDFGYSADMSKIGGRRLIRLIQAIALAWLAWSLLAPPLAPQSTLGIAPGSCHHLNGPSLLLSRRARYSVVVDREPSHAEMAIDGGDDPRDDDGSLARPNAPLPLPTAGPRPSPLPPHACRPATRLRC
jgi:hypothetical protein